MAKKTVEKAVSKDAPEKENIKKDVVKPKPKKEVIETVDFETGKVISTPESDYKEPIEWSNATEDTLVGSTESDVDVKIAPYIEPKPIDLTTVVTNPEVEELKLQITAFTHQTYIQVYAQRHILEEAAFKSFGNDITILTGASQLEVAFIVKGIRIPEEGFFFIRH